MQISGAGSGIVGTGIKPWATIDLSLAMQQMLMADSQVGDKQEYQYV